MLTPHCSAASGIVVPPSIVSTTRLRKSAEYGFAIHAGLLPAGTLNHIRAAMGIPDSAFPGNALACRETGFSLDCRALPSREILPQRGSDLLQRPVDLVAGDHKWRGDADGVSVGVLGKDASALQCLTVATCIACFRVKLDRQHEPASAHVTDGIAADAP